MRPELRWAAAIGGLIAYDIWCDRNDTPGDTLSEVIRRTYRTRSPRGRAAFLVSWLALSAWFGPHICEEAENLGA